MEFHHKSVLLDEVIENLLIRPEGIYADGTLGGGGHSEAILAHLSSTGKLIGIDRDLAAITAAGEPTSWTRRREGFPTWRMHRWT